MSRAIALLRTNLVATRAIAHATYQQLVRDPALLLIAAGALLLIVTAPAYAVFHFDEAAKVMIDTGLSTVLLAGLIIGLIGPVRALAYELEDRTALTLLSKPVGRLPLVAGKYLGVLAALAGVSLPLVLAVLYVARITDSVEEIQAAEAVLPLIGATPGGVAPLIYLGCGAALAAVAAGLIFKRSRAGAVYGCLVCCAAIGPLIVGRASEWRWAVLAAGALIFMEVAVIAAVAVAAAVRLGTVGTLVAGLSVMILGHARSLSGPEVLSGGILAAFGSIVPGLEALNALEAAAGGATVDGLYVASAAIYATMYAGAAILVGAALMQAREVA